MYHAYRRLKLVFIAILILVLLGAEGPLRAKEPPPDPGSSPTPDTTSWQMETHFTDDGGLISHVQLLDKNGQPLKSAGGEVQLLDESGQQIDTLDLQIVGPGTYRLIVPGTRIQAAAYMDIQLNGKDSTASYRHYEIDHAQHTLRLISDDQPPTSLQSTVAPQATGGPDEFGYSWDNTASYSWVDTSGGSTVSMRDDDWTGPFNIGFTFNFYGQNYTSFYIDSNGYLGFDDTQLNSYYANAMLPDPARPNDLIAPFWDDFNPDNGGTIRYQTFGSAPNRYLVVEWNQVPLYYSPSDQQMFQAILYEGSNDIKFQYPDTREGDYGNRTYGSVGIENAAGTIGLSYPYVIPITQTVALHFDHGQADYNVFLTPDLQGSPTAAGETATFEVTVQNLGSRSDNFTLSRPAYDGENWSVGFYASNGTPLSGNKTGTIASGTSKTILAKVTVPDGASVGDWSRTTFRATSDGNNSEHHEVYLDTMVGTSFAQVYVDNESDDNTDDLENYFASLQAGEAYGRRLTTDQDDSDYAGVATTPDNEAITMWNTSYYNGNTWVSDIQYARLGASGSFVQSIQRLTDNSTATDRTYDFSPAADVAPNGNTALGWAKQVDTDGDGYNNQYNVWAAFLNSSGNSIVAPDAITNNTTDYPRDYPPSVAALINNRFLFTWEHAAASGGPVDVYYAILNNDGSTYQSMQALTGGTGWNVTPRATPLPNGNVAIVWTTYNSSDYREISYALLDSDGNVLSGPNQITSNGSSGTESYYADIVALSDNRLAVAWTQDTGSAYEIQYTIIDPQAAPECTTLVSEDFEGTFPGSTWEVKDRDGSTSGEYYWGKSNCQTNAGSYSGWAVGAGADGSALTCSSNYPDNASAWMIYGPFSLADATAADLAFKIWLNSEYNTEEAKYDRLCRLVSTDGNNFSGPCAVGSTGGEWFDSTLDLSDVGSNSDNYLGESQVWLAFVFMSDASVTYPEGAFVDDIVLRKCTAASCTTTQTASEMSTLPQLDEVTIQLTRPDDVEAIPVSEDSTPSSMQPSATIHTVTNNLTWANYYVSLTTDEDDHLIMTWLDSYTQRYLFYALADSDGTEQTPATVFQRTRRDEIWSSWNGYGNDQLAPTVSTGPHTLYLPLILRGYPLPPPPPPITNGGFEAGDFSGWTKGGDKSVLQPQIVTNRRHGGTYAVVLGQENAPCQSGQGGEDGRSWVQQAFTVPSSGSAELSLYYRVFTYDKLNAAKYDRFEIYINGTLLGRFGNTDLASYGCDNPINDLTWREFTYDLSAYRGQTVELELINITHPDDWYGTWTYIDDVAVGD